VRLNPNFTTNLNTLVFLGT